MKIVNQIYINGEFKTPHGNEIFDLVNPSNREIIGKLTLGNAQDVDEAVGKAKLAFKTFSKSTVKERQEILERIRVAVLERKEELAYIQMVEYGGSLNRARWSIDYAAESLTNLQKILETYEFKQDIGKARVHLGPVGVTGIITPWNSNYIFIVGKLASAIAAGCTTVIKPSEMSGLQTQIITECLHKANIPKGVFNIINGRGDVVGAAISRHPDIAKISFTGSTAVGKEIARIAVPSMKRITLELGGKSPNIILDDADFSKAIPLAVAACFMNNSQACVAGTRLLVPKKRLDEVKRLVKEVMENYKMGELETQDTTLGPLVSQKQWDRVQSYIKLGLEEGAELLTGGLGFPKGFEAGNFVKPTAFFNVKNSMRIAREEIFGPVLSIITYETEEEAVEIANDTEYGLQAYVSGSPDRAHKIATLLEAGTVQVNGLHFEPLAPFGGVKQSGIGREHGVYGMEEYLEPKTIMG